MRRRVSIFGATGSVGRNTVSLLDAQGGAERLRGGGADRRRQRRAARRAGAAARRARRRHRRPRPAGRARAGARGQRHRGGGRAGGAARRRRPSRSTGRCRRSSARRASRRGSRLARHGGVLALANKESMVCAGDLLRRTCAAHGTRLIPVDSEHSAIFQALRGERRAEVERIILTASGGPFRDWTRRRMASGHARRRRGRIPNWDMGERISIDSATHVQQGARGHRGARALRR